MVVWISLITLKDSQEMTKMLKVKVMMPLFIEIEFSVDMLIIIWLYLKKKAKKTSKNNSVNGKRIYLRLKLKLLKIFILKYLLKLEKTQFMSKKLS